MKSVRWVRGYVHTIGYNDLSWITPLEGDEGYFLLNCASRIAFGKDIYPDIKRGTCIIDKGLLTHMIKFRQVPELGDTREVVFPNGISPFEWQTESLKRMVYYNRYALFLGTGAGKTLIAISFLLSTPSLKGSNILVVTPKKVIEQYEKEIAKYLTQDYVVTVTNFESLHKLGSTKYSCVFIDESHRAKAYTSGIHKALEPLCRDATFVYLFSGTPIDKNRHDIFSQLALLYIHYMPTKSKFLQRYFRLDDYYQPKSEIREVQHELDEMIRHICYFKQDVFKLKEHNQEVVCSSPCLEYYQLYTTRVLDTPEIVADNKATLRVKLRQLCGGHCIADDGELYIFKAPKIDKLRQLICELDSAIIYTEFDGDIRLITVLLNTLSVPYGIINGATKDVASVTDAFKNGSIRFLIMQAKAGSTGLDLSCTSNMVFYSLPESFIVFTQCKGRINRPGQTVEPNYYYLLCENSVDQQIYRALKNKKSFTNKLFKL